MASARTRPAGAAPAVTRTLRNEPTWMLFVTAGAAPAGRVLADAIG